MYSQFSGLVRSCEVPIKCLHFSICPSVSLFAFSVSSIAELAHIKFHIEIFPSNFIWFISSVILPLRYHPLYSRSSRFEPLCAHRLLQGGQSAKSEPRPLKSPLLQSSIFLHFR
jgi:hypothetical protein